MKKVFIIGLPQSGRTCLIEELLKAIDFVYINCNLQIENGFRSFKIYETKREFQDAYEIYYLNKLKLDPDFCSKNIQKIIDFNLEKGNFNFIIDNLISPRDFVKLFNYNEDIVVFLNRIDYGDVEYKEHQNVALSSIRDYCFWMSSLGLMKKENWIEFNFVMNSNGINENSPIKKLGIYNTVYLAKSFLRVVSTLKDILIS